MQVCAHPLPGPLHLHLVKVAVLKGFFAKSQFPVAGSLYALKLITRCFFPIVEIAYEVYLSGVRCPLTEHPALGQLVKAEIEVPAGKVRQRLLAVGSDLPQFPQSMVMPAPYCVLIRFKPRVVLNQSDMLVCRFGWLLTFCLSFAACCFLINHIASS